MVKVSPFAAGPIRSTVFFDPGTVPTMAARMDVLYRAALVKNLKGLVDLVIEDAQSQLQPGHGYDTGLMHDTLMSQLLDDLLPTGVYYSLFSNEADYWAYVEFGHMTLTGTWWEGYHFLQNAIDGRQLELMETAKRSWHEAALAARAGADLTGIVGFIL